MNEVQREMLKNAGLLHEVAEGLVTAIEAGDYRRVSDASAKTGEAMHELSRLAVTVELYKEER